MVTFLMFLLALFLLLVVMAVVFIALLAIAGPLVAVIVDFVLGVLLIVWLFKLIFGKKGAK